MTEFDRKESSAENYAAGNLWCCEIDGDPANRKTSPCNCRGCYGYRLARQYEVLRDERITRVNASDIDPTAGADPNFKWDGDG
jgi:hypothetical protein